MSDTTSEFLARLDEGLRAWRAQCREALRPGRTAMADAVTKVTQLGYSTEQCSITETMDGVSEKRTLHVLGQPCFEVTIAAGPRDRPFDTTYTTRLIAWPPAVSS